MKDRPWAEGDDEYPDPPAEAAPEMEAVSAEPPNPQREVSHPVFDPTDGPLVAPDEEDDSQFKWLGFKRSADEADEMMYARPIPKFSLSEEEKAAQEAAEQGADCIPQRICRAYQQLSRPSGAGSQGFQVGSTDEGPRKGSFWSDG